MFGLKPFILTFFFIISVSSQENFTPEQTRLIVEYLQKDGTCQYSYLESKVRYFPECFQDTVEKIKELVPSNSIPSDFSKKLCLIDLTECLVEIGYDLKHCLNEDTYKTTFEKPTKTISSMQEYACTDDGKPLQDFLDKGLPCVANAEYGIDVCKQAMSHQVHAISPNIFEDLKMEEMCPIATEFGACVIAAVDFCEDKTAQNFIKNMFIKVLEINCKDHVARISSSTVVSEMKMLLFITAVLHLAIFNFKC